MRHINVVVFSKDRACQLDLLMQSIEAHAPWMWPTSVLYAASNADFARSYTDVQSKWNLPLAYQLPLKEKILQAVDPAVKFTSFLVDDAVYYRRLGIRLPAPGRQFSPRLGKNTTYCYTVNALQREGELDFVYPFSIDGHIYRTADILPRIQAATFTTPNQFEDMVAHDGHILPIDYDAHSSLVNIPHNKVGEYSNRHFGGSNVELNRNYLNGLRIDLAEMDFYSVVGAHQEIEYKWRTA